MQNVNKELINDIGKCKDMAMHIWLLSPIEDELSSDIYDLYNRLYDIEEEMVKRQNHELELEQKLEAIQKLLFI